MSSSKQHPRNRWRSLALKIATGYGLVCLLLYFQQQRLMFFPREAIANTPALYDLNYEDVSIPIELEREQVEEIHGWWIPAGREQTTEQEDESAPVLLYFHHNAVNIGANVSQALQFHQLGYSVFLFDYRGFGQSEGDFPHESQVYQDAQTVWEYLTQDRNIPPSQIIIYGHSIGGAIAIDLAANQPDAAALIVQSSFTSMRDMTKRFGIYWLLPVELLLKQRFESLEKMPSVEMPVLILTGTADLQIPTSMGERLYAAATEMRQLVVIEEGGHDNHLQPQHSQQLQQFIDAAMDTANPDAS